MRFERPLKILIHGLNYAPEMVGVAVYTTGLAEELARRGHEVAVVAGKAYYPGWMVHPDLRGGWRRRTCQNNVDLTYVAHYIPANPSGLKRVLHHMSFAFSSVIPLLLLAWRQRPDVVFVVAPSLIAAPFGRLAALVGGAKSWIHIQDFEVEAAIATGLVARHGIGTRLAYWFEERVLQSFGRVSSISPAMCRKCADKGVAVDRIVEFRNWAEIDHIRPAEGTSTYRMDWNILTPHVALYSGNIANKQGIEILVEVAKSLSHRADLTFVICGEGPNRVHLERLAEGLTNVQFHDLQPKERLNDLLGLATIHLLPQLAGTADLVLPSKMANMMASGRAIIATTLPETGLAEEVSGCGLIVPPGDAIGFARAIETLLDHEDIRLEFALEGRKRAEERWERGSIIDHLEADFRTLLE